jgi:hypothetical protein
MLMRACSQEKDNVNEEREGELNEGYMNKGLGVGIQNKMLLDLRRRQV